MFDQPSQMKACTPLNIFNSMNRKDVLAQCHECNGMLPDDVYIRLFQSVAHLDRDPIVEIGTAHGAATTAIGLGSLQHTTKRRIITVDTYGGRFSSRSRFGTPEMNYNIVISNLKRAGILDIVHVFRGSSSEFARSGECPSSISMLMLDADGRIDRDFMLFYPLLNPGGLIVIDDADDDIFLSLNHHGEPYVDLKHRITHLLIAQFRKALLIEDLEMVGNTLFCKSTGASLDHFCFLEMCLNTYRELVFSVGGEHWQDLAIVAPQSAIARRALRLYNMAMVMSRPIRKLAKTLQAEALLRKFLR